MKIPVSINIDAAKCINCNACISICPAKILHDEGGKIKVSDPSLCGASGCCAKTCPAGAINIIK